MAQKPTDWGKKRGGAKKGPPQPMASAPATPKPAQPAAQPHTAVAAPAPQAVAAVVPPPKPPVAAPQPAPAPKPVVAESAPARPAVAAEPAAAPQPAPKPAPEPSALGAEFDDAHKKYGAAYAVMAEGLKGDGVDTLVKYVQYGLAASAVFVVLAAIIAA